MKGYDEESDGNIGVHYIGGDRNKREASNYNTKLPRSATKATAATRKGTHSLKATTKASTFSGSTINGNFNDLNEESEEDNLRIRIKKLEEFVHELKRTVAVKLQNLTSGVRILKNQVGKL